MWPCFSSVLCSFCVAMWHFVTLSEFLKQSLYFTGLKGSHLSPASCVLVNQRSFSSLLKMLIRCSNMWLIDQTGNCKSTNIRTGMSSLLHQSLYLICSLAWSWMFMYLLKMAKAIERGRAMVRGVVNSNELNMNSFACITDVSYKHVHTATTAGY